jgi:hypothetical protein
MEMVAEKSILGGKRLPVMSDFILSEVGGHMQKKVLEQHFIWE